ncbi:NPCBM/NEW2 domain-containing protein [Bacillus sp. RG28]|uniref:NPCBM/NEW2 domain-containing protein n=1 Tax=Gottfriedia endophytica TaxID=2820819 RepID=A0A940NPW7_9BACI|nr:NPCBM/NEW2 domain-containing protein [Gottfriedia endophytica]MBP0726621.1 NPCBM/NEW2 domain-containing protein [Gottfriedia endophytica]
MVTETLGYPTVFNKTKNILYMGYNPYGSYLKDVVGEPYFTSYGTEYRSVNYDNYRDFYYAGGTFYSKGYALKIHSGKQETAFNLKKKYTEFKGSIGYSSKYHEYNIPTNLKIYGDGGLLFNIDMKPGDLPYPLTLDVDGINKLSFVFNGEYGEINDSNFNEVIICDPIVK